MLCIVPSVNLALTGFDMTELRYASALFNLRRNLGGAVGIATVNTWLQDGARIQAARFGEALGEAGRHASGVIGALSERIGHFTPDSAHALLIAQPEVAQVVSRAALTLAFNEVFRLMSWLFIAALILVPFCRPVKNSPPPATESH